MLLGVKSFWLSLDARRTGGKESFGVDVPPSGHSSAHMLRHLWLTLAFINLNHNASVTQNK